MKKLLAILLIFISVAAYSQILPPRDKLLHYIAGAAISDVTYLAVYNHTGNHNKAMLYSLGASIVAGTLKEIYDINRSGFDKRDLAYTAAGGFTVTISFQFNMHNIIFWDNKKHK